MIVFNYEKFDLAKPSLLSKLFWDKSFDMQRIACFMDKNWKWKLIADCIKISRLGWTELLFLLFH